MHAVFERSGREILKPTTINMEKKYMNCPLCGTPCEIIHEHSDMPVEETWESFWKPIVTNKDGTINLEQLKKELADFSFIMEQVPKVYCHITGDKMSYVTYRAEDVIRVADDHFNEQLKEAIKEEKESMEVNPDELWDEFSTATDWGTIVMTKDGFKEMMDKFKQK
jgi:hypothetical protein